MSYVHKWRRHTDPFDAPASIMLPLPTGDIVLPEAGIWRIDLSILTAPQPDAGNRSLVLLDHHDAGAASNDLYYVRPWPFYPFGLSLAVSLHWPTTRRTVFRPRYYTDAVRGDRIDRVMHLITYLQE